MENSKKSYQPVACEFVDQIEDAATRKVSGSIKYYSENGSLQNVEGAAIKTWENEQGEEFLITDQNEKIRLDRIVSLFGKKGPAAE